MISTTMVQGENNILMTVCDKMIMDMVHTGMIQFLHVIITMIKMLITNVGVEPMSSEEVEGTTMIGVIMMTQELTVKRMMATMITRRIETVLNQTHVAKDMA